MKASSLLHSTQKTVLVNTPKGLDQLGHAIGTPQPGDVVKCHMKASYVAPTKSFFGTKKKTRTREFLDTGRVGETCFYEVTIPPKPKEVYPPTAQDIITDWIQSMTLGEVSKFELDLQDDEAKWIFVTEPSSSSSSSIKRKLLHRSQHAHVPETVQQVIFRISSFRIVRNQKEYRRKVQNGRGATMWGSFAMTC